MRKVILYIAVSLDGYIADSEGSVEWISGQDKNVEMEDTFTPFFSGVDTVIMGKRTYDQIVTELSPDQLTHHSEEEGTENIRFRNMDVCQLVEELKQESGKDVWICGGAEVAQQLIANNQIDIYHLAIIPVLLGNGTRLFGATDKKIDLEMIRTKKYNGIIEVVYSRRKI